MKDDIYDVIMSHGLSRESIIELGIGPEHFASVNDMPAGLRVSSDKISQFLSTPHIVMHSGAFAGVKDSSSENWFTQQFLKHTHRAVSEDGVVYTPEADLNIRALASLYRINGHLVTILPPKPGNIDGIYSTDSDKSFQVVKPIFVDGKTLWEFEKPVTIFPKFTHENRDVEVPWKRRFLESGNQNPNLRARRRLIQMQNNMEFGDTRIVFHKTSGADTGFILAGIADSDEMAIGRSTKEGHEEFQRHLHEHVSQDIKIETIYLKQPFYHMDTTGPNTSGQHMFTHQEAYAPESWEKLQSLFGDGLVEIPYADIGPAFGGNATNFGDKVYISDRISEASAKKIAEHGYDVYLSPIPYTMASGGGHRCMTSVNPHIYVPGAYDLNLDQSRTGTLYKQEIDYENSVITLKEQNSSGQWVNPRDLSHCVSEHIELYRQEMERYKLTI